MTANGPGKPDYLQVTYALDRLPKTAYPSRLARLLTRTVYLKPGRILDVGCGRGEYLQEFLRLGFSGAGVDGAASSAGFAAGCEIKTVDLDSQAFPFPDAGFDFVFSKSVVEHLRRPEAMIAECLRVLKPGGTAVLMTPSWRHTQKIFFEDFGHIKPFGANALSDALTLAGFRDVKVGYFRQLPVLWDFPFLKPLSCLTALLPLPYRPWDRAPWPDSLNTWIRFSKEQMLLATAVK
jgi:SAM-dependent methyltransferase